MSGEAIIQSIEMTNDFATGGFRVFAYRRDRRFAKTAAPSYAFITRVSREGVSSIPEIVLLAAKATNDAGFMAQFPKEELGPATEITIDQLRLIEAPPEAE